MRISGCSKCRPEKRRRPLPSPNIMEVIPLEEICLVRNERGKLMGLPGGRRLGNDVIAGTFFLAGDSPASGFCSLTPEQIDLWGRYFAQPEVFQPDEVERSIRIEFYTM